MEKRIASFRRRFVGTLAALAAITSLAACSKTPTGANSQSETGAPSTATSLATEFPEKYASWARQSTQITACSFEPVRKSPNGTLDIRGWGIIDAAAGVVPEAFILKIEKDGSEFYPEVQPQERPDLATKFGKPALSRSGFKVALTPGQIQPPFTGTMIIAFDKRLFNCEYKIKI